LLLLLLLLLVFPDDDLFIDDKDDVENVPVGVKVAAGEGGGAAAAAAMVAAAADIIAPVGRGTWPVPIEVNGDTAPIPDICIIPLPSGGIPSNVDGRCDGRAEGFNPGILIFHNFDKTNCTSLGSRTFDPRC
jgi:hypothetical protein